MANPRVGFIGTGVMGTSMASSIMKGGYELAVYNRTQQRAMPLVEKGAVLKPTVAELAAWADVIITIVGYPKDVEQVYLGSGGILENAHPGAYVVDMTTSSPKLAARIYEAAKEKKIYALDAPVSGGDVGAKNATLSIMVGGDESAFNALMPIFSLMGKNIMLHGGPGAGQQTKMCNQIAIAATIMGVCECLSYAKKAGLDGTKVLETLSGGAAASAQLSIYGPRIFKKDYDPGFYIKHFVKDMGIALEEAESMKLEMPALTLSKSLFDKLMDENMGDLGTQALYKLYEE